jgi:hypothetical protein
MTHSKRNRKSSAKAEGAAMIIVPIGKAQWFQWFLEEHGDILGYTVDRLKMVNLRGRFIPKKDDSFRMTILRSCRCRKHENKMPGGLVND